MQETVHVRVRKGAEEFGLRRRLLCAQFSNVRWSAVPPLLRLPTQHAKGQGHARAHQNASVVEFRVRELFVNDNAELEWSEPPEGAS